MKKQNQSLTKGLTMLGLTAGVTGMLLGGMSKMFGLNDEKTPQKLAQEMMAGAVEGILNHFEWKMDEQKRYNL